MRHRILVLVATAVIAILLIACTSSTETVPGGTTTADDAGADSKSVSCSAGYAPDGAYTGDCPRQPRGESLGDLPDANALVDAGSGSDASDAARD